MKTLLNLTGVFAFMFLSMLWGSMVGRTAKARTAQQRWRDEELKRGAMSQSLYDSASIKTIDDTAGITQHHVEPIY